MARFYQVRVVLPESRAVAYVSYCLRPDSRGFRKVHFAFLDRTLENARREGDIEAVMEQCLADALRREAAERRLKERRERECGQ